MTKSEKAEAYLARYETLPDDDDVLPWLIELLHEVEKTRDPMLLLPLLKVSKGNAKFFYNLFRRMKFKAVSRELPLWHVQGLPILHLAVRRVKDRAPGVTQKDAITEQVKLLGINGSALERAMKGKRPRYRKWKKEHPALD